MSEGEREGGARERERKTENITSSAITKKQRKKR